ncbi:MAG: PLP-dependent transferase [Clostridia bacterium]|nr:PLP-dependent transferase [Clostridia bacterium]
MKFNTIAAQAGMCTDKQTGAISTPIYQTATFRHLALGVSTGYDYSRTANPTRAALEETIALLEGGHKGFAFATGMAAITALLMTFASGDHLIVCDDLYGGTYRILEKNFKQFGLTASYVDTADPAEIEQAIVLGKTKGILVETPTNPLMKITDLAKLVALAKKHKLITMVDNTFLTPYLQKPLSLGVDLVIHSGTKFLGGHNDVLAGLIVTSTPELSEQIGFIQNSTGGVLGPQDSWLMLRGIKTLSVRLDRQQENAQRIAAWLAAHPRVTGLYYPGLPNHPDHEIQKQQSSGFGAMLSFRVETVDLAAKIINSLKVIPFAESLGGVESLITHPAKQTHGDIPVEMREKLGINDDLLRLSVGIEDIDDLINDLDQAMA